MDPENENLLNEAIENLENIKSLLVDNLMFYLNKPDANPAFIDMKEKEIKGIDASITLFKTILENIVNKVNILENKVFSLEALAVYYGITLFEINHFTKRPIKNIVSDVKTALNENYRQMPILYKPGDKTPLNELKTTKETVYNWKPIITNYNEQKAHKQPGRL